MEGILGNPHIKYEDCLRLALLFALRYETGARAELEQVHRLLVSRGADETEVKVRSQGDQSPVCSLFWRFHSMHRSLYKGRFQSAVLCMFVCARSFFVL